MPPTIDILAWKRRFGESLALYLEGSRVFLEPYELEFFLDVAARRYVPGHSEEPRIVGLDTHKEA